MVSCTLHVQTPRVADAVQFLHDSGSKIHDGTIRAGTIDALKPDTCIVHLAGVFLPVCEDGSACPKLPQRFDSAPGSNFGGHHSYPGGLAIHESFNLSSLNVGNEYRQ